ncbi:ATP-dependent Clp protease ATP-binding subunit ClpX [Brevibacillus sp. NPDC058079]|uniref:ATP-dependent Clp protease ATP-binding subunit ClpX n=1 Tax=Brevibacillus sp. NPDC058079 TaxID=3346330 RepID=UPI0036ED7226
MEKQCSFCGREETLQMPVIEGADAFICKECAETCVEEMQTPQYSPSKNGLKPHEIKEELDHYVIGQEEAKKILSVAAYNHYKRINSKSKVEIQKSNILITGPTGSGKTYLIETLSKVLDVPLVIADATSLTQAGYVGEDVESVLEKLLIKADGNVRKAEQGIVYIDEIDKIASYEVSGQKRTKDIAGQGVQESLLKIIEGSEIHLQVGNHSTMKQRVVFNTKNVLFIFGGAFVGLQELIKKRITGVTKTLGFTATPAQQVEKQDNEVTQQDLVEFGFIPEFVGRIPVTAMLNSLDKKDLINILIKPKNAAVKQYQALFKMDGVKLSFHKSAIEYIAEEALKKNVGARGLKGIVEKKMYDLMYYLPQQNHIDSITITKEMLVGNSLMDSIQDQLAS